MPKKQDKVYFSLSSFSVSKQKKHPSFFPVIFLRFCTLLKFSRAREDKFQNKQMYTQKKRKPKNNAGFFCSESKHSPVWSFFFRILSITCLENFAQNRTWKTLSILFADPNHFQSLNSTDGYFFLTPPLKKSEYSPQQKRPFYPWFEIYAYFYTVFSGTIFPGKSTIMGGGQKKKYKCLNYDFKM